MQRPIFLLAADDQARLEGLSRDLSRRYEADYRVVGATSAREALASLADLAGSGAEIALVIADQHLGDMPGLASWPGTSPANRRSWLSASSGRRTRRDSLGFPRGLSGEELTNRAGEQAWLFGVNFTLARADGLTAQGATRITGRDLHRAGGPRGPLAAGPAAAAARDQHARCVRGRGRAAPVHQAGRVWRSAKAPPPSSSCTTICRRSTAGKHKRPAEVRRPATRSPIRS